jgi:hypothetical protein
MNHQLTSLSSPFSSLLAPSFSVALTVWRPLADAGVLHRWLWKTQFWESHIENTAHPSSPGTQQMTGDTRIAEEPQGPSGPGMGGLSFSRAFGLGLQGWWQP